MPATTRRGVTTPVTGAAVIAGLILTIDPGTAAAADITFTNSCQAKSIITVDKTLAGGITVDAPASVNVGDTFTYRVQPDAQSYPDKDSGATTSSLSRIKYDFAIPANATLVSADVVSGTAVNIDNVAPNVLRVNDSGVVDANGSILRLSGNNEVVGNSPTSSTNTEGGIRAPKLKKNLDGTTNANGDSWFRLPAVDVTVTAVAAGTITPTVRVAGSAAAYGNDMNYNTSLAKASLLGTQWAPTRCIPSDNKSALNAGGGPLATITVGAASVATTTTVSVPATATIGQSVDLSAAVHGTAGAAVGGTVQFLDNGANIGGPVAVTNGAATLPYTFTTAGAHAISAVYSGADGYQGSTGAAQTVTVAVAAVATTTTLTAPATAATGQSVDLSAAVNGTAGAAVGGTVQFLDNGANIGSPVAVANGTATLPYTFNAAGTHAISAVYSGADGYLGSTAAAQTVTVSVPVTTTVPPTSTTTPVTSTTAPVTTTTGSSGNSGSAAMDILSGLSGALGH
ncbi:Ig-like domain-containing protein [Nocardia stercoris]|nr:Ig-like domain-containing protein [Nocardia stercoris]